MKKLAAAILFPSRKCLSIYHETGTNLELRKSIKSWRVACCKTLILVMVALPRESLGCDHPGTPNQEQLRSDGHGQLVYSFENTARVSPIVDTIEQGQKLNLWFDMNMGDGNSPESHNWTYIENDGPHALSNHERVTLVIRTMQTQQVNPVNRAAALVDRPLKIGAKYCMTVWARVGPNDCRSRVHSSWQCAVVQP